MVDLTKKKTATEYPTAKLLDADTVFTYRPTNAVGEKVFRGIITEGTSDSIATGTSTDLKMYSDAALKAAINGGAIPIGTSAQIEAGTDTTPKIYAPDQLNTAVVSIIEANVPDGTEAQIIAGSDASERKYTPADINGAVKTIAVAQYDSIADIESITGQAAEQAVYLSAGGRSGTFIWDGSDLSAEVAADTLQGVYIAPSSDATGASGAWVRRITEFVNAEWFGLSESEPENGQYINAALVFADFLSGGASGSGGKTVLIPDGNYQHSLTINILRYGWLKGGGRLTCQLSYTGTGESVVFENSSSGFAGGGGQISDIWLRGPGDLTGVGTSVGLRISDTFGFKVKDVTISRFNMGLRLRNVRYWTEGTIVDDVKVENSIVCVRFDRDAASGSTDSFAYTRIKNLALSPEKNSGVPSYGFQFGDPASSGDDINIYNSQFSCHIWGGADVTAGAFYSGAYVRNCFGFICGEDDGGTPYSIFTYEDNLLCGFEGAKPDSNFSHGDVGSHFSGNEVFEYRGLNGDDSGASGSGENWLKVCELTSAQSDVSGVMSSQARRFFNDFNSCRVAFSVGYDDGSGVAPEFFVFGDAIASTQAAPERRPGLRVYKSASSGNTVVFFRIPELVSRANFIIDAHPWGDSGPSYAWELSKTDPAGDADLSLLYDSDTSAYSSHQRQYAYGGTATVQVSVSSSAANLQDSASRVNTLRAGEQAWDTTNSRPLWKKTTSLTGDWVDSSGTTVFTPV